MSKVRAATEGSASLQIMAAIRGALVRRSTKSIRTASEANALSVIRALFDGLGTRRQVQLTRRMVDALELKQREAAVFKLQSAYRAHYKTRQVAADILQNTWVRHVAYRRLQLLKAARSIVSKFVLARVWRKRFLAVRKATVTVQRALRRHAMRRNIAAAIVQRLWRGRKSRQRVQRRKQMIYLIQATWRGKMVRKCCSKAMNECRIRLKFATAGVQENLN